jgi:hypothetical protein
MLEPSTWDIAKYKYIKDYPKRKFGGNCCATTTPH